MNISTEHILQCNQSKPLADASGRIVGLMNENGIGLVQWDFLCDAKPPIQMSQGHPK